MATLRDKLEPLADWLLARAQEPSSIRAAAGIIATALGRQLNPGHLDQAVYIGVSAAWAIGLVLPEQLKKGRSIQGPSLLGKGPGA